MFKLLCNVAISLKNSNKFSIFSALNAKSHYDALGVTPHATQNEIKTAYYKLSMKFHPDKNEGSKDAAQKFRSITAAYEVLGNYRLRKLYDKGLIHTVGLNVERRQGEEEDDDQTKFYKSRFRRSQAPPTGRPTIYNFDEWSRAHYGATFARTKFAKERVMQRAEKARRDVEDIKSEIAMYGMAAFIILCIAALSFLNEEYDDVKTRPKE